MKKILFSFMCIFIFVLSSCDTKKSNSNPEASATSYLEKLDSYELSCEMTIHRTNKDVVMDINAMYLKPSYYKVTFSNGGNNEQIIVKNDNGVFVLTPALNKEFRFDSDWPINTSHAYLIEGIVANIRTDQNKKVSINDSLVTFEAQLTSSNPKMNKMIFVFDYKEKMPKSSCFFDADGNKTIEVSFKSFTANKALNKDMFDNKKIMDEESNKTENTSTEEKNFTLSVGYVIDGTKLASSKISDDSSILCYSGNNPYTIVVKRADNYNNILQECYNSLDYSDYGLIVSNTNVSRVFIDDYEVSIYANNLTISEVVEIISEISMS